MCPYISEYDTTPTLVDCVSSSGDGGTTNFGSQITTDRIRNQYGWRSKGELGSAQKALKSVTRNRSQWKDTAHIIDAMDRVSRAMDNPKVRRDRYLLEVHDRYYTEFNYAGAIREVELTTPTLPNRMIAFPSVTPSVTYTQHLGEVQARNVAGSMMRDSRPTRPHANLGQFIGELRDSALMTRSTNYVPKSSRDVGGAYLNMVFGLKLFANDLRQAAQAIVDSEKIINQFLLDASKQVHRTRYKVIQEGLAQATSNGVLNGTSVVAFPPYTPVRVQLEKLSNNRYFTLAGNTLVTCHWKESVRSFATFEYFAFDPDGFLGRINSYGQKARILLGLSGDAPTIWELTRFSWMADWFYDIGGLLAYQESVASDSLVSSRTGFVYESVVNGVLHVTLPPTYYGGRYWSSEPTGWQIPYSLRDQIRLKGSPYDMGVDTSALSPQQIFILAALGLTKGPDGDLL